MPTSWKDRFTKGSIVRLKPKYPKGNWEGFTTGVILGPSAQLGFGSRAGDPDKNWKVRWDAYDYGGDPTNAHTVNDVAITGDEPDESELAETLASIQDAARKTMSKEAP